MQRDVPPSQATPGLSKILIDQQLVAATLALNGSGKPSVEEVLIELLDKDHLFDPAAYIESDHQPGEK